MVRQARIGKIPKGVARKISHAREVFQLSTAWDSQVLMQQKGVKLVLACGNRIRS
jgi:hypothetical protein